MLIVNAQKPVHPSSLELQVPLGVFAVVRFDLVNFYRSENPDQHIEKMYPDVGGDAPGLRQVSLPACVIPVTTGSNVSQVDIVDLVLRTIPDLLPQRDDGRMKSQLQDSVYSLARFSFN